MLRRVHVLDPGVAERIAAGEVIERPASVVKELVENSLDAGATEIVVLLEAGGKSLIEVCDNGNGIGRDDLGICVQRHATSKLKSLDDLERISTLGFRGEALPSIAAVSELSILSRERGSDVAHELRMGGLEAGLDAVTFGHFIGAPHGTRVQARGLFSQVPARLKFLKSQAAEVGQAREWLERIALAHPGTGFRLVSDGRQILALRPQEEIARVQAVLSDGEEYPVVSASSDLGLNDRAKGKLQLRAHWLQGLSSPQTRRLAQVVNGRSVRDRLLQQAILAAFRQTLLPGQFPAVAVFIEIDPSELDVNVHPAKTEIRFLDNRRVFHAIESLLSSLIGRNGAPAVIPASLAPQAGAPHGEPYHPTQAAQGGWGDAAGAAQGRGFSPSLWNAAEPAAPLGIPTENAGELRPERFLGIAFSTYLLYDAGQDLVLIDQHAAHERIRFEKLRWRAIATHGDARAQAVGTQPLLIPEAVHFPAEERVNLLPRLAWLEALGFETEIFGESALLFRSIPAEWGGHELRTRLKNLVDRALSIELPGEPSDEAASPGGARALLLDEALFEKLASEACHSAVRAGDRLEREEALELVAQLFRCEHPWNCPHGRPTVARVSRGKVEEWFQRRI